MPWPGAEPDIDDSNLNQATDDPNLAKDDLFDLVGQHNDMKNTSVLEESAAADINAVYTFNASTRFTAAWTWLSNSAAALGFDSLTARDGRPIKRITCNDGAGNWNFRGGHYVSSLKDTYATSTDGATRIVHSFESVNGGITIAAASVGTGGTDVSWGAQILVDGSAQAVKVVTGDLDLNGNAIVAVSTLAVTSTTTTGRLRVTASDDASLSSNAHGFQVGPTTGGNVIIDGNEVMARSNGGTATLFLNADGGAVSVASLLTAGHLRCNGEASVVNAHVNGDLSVSGSAVVESTGFFRIKNANDVGVSTTSHGFQIGPTSGANIAMDGNEILARNNNGISQLNLNTNGGTVFIGGSVIYGAPSQEHTKAYCVFQGTGTAHIMDSYRVDSLTDNAVGTWTINLQDDYAALSTMCCTIGHAAATSGTVAFVNWGHGCRIFPLTVSTIRVEGYNAADNPAQTASRQDYKRINVHLTGERA